MPLWGWAGPPGTNTLEVPKSSGGHCKDRGKDSDGSLDFRLQELERSSGIEWSSLESIIFCPLENGHPFLLVGELHLYGDSPALHFSLLAQPFFLLASGPWLLALFSLCSHHQLLLSLSQLTPQRPDPLQPSALSMSCKAKRGGGTVPH